MGRQVTVFGGSGFVGRSLVRLLARRGWTVRVAVRRPGQARDLQPLGDVGQIVAVPCRVQDPALVREALAGADGVVNLTGILYEKGSQTFDAIHRDGAATIARAAAEAGVGRLVQMSALGAAADSPSRYAQSKAAGEAAVKEAFPGACIVRPSVVFGPGDSFFNRFAAMALISPCLPLIGGGRTRFQPVFVGDVAQAIVACLEDPAQAGKTFELGGPQAYGFRELLELLLREIGRRRLLLNLPVGLALFQAAFLELLPDPPLTRDQVRLLGRDSVVGEGALGLADLGVEARSIELILPDYISCYRVGGPYRDNLPT